MALATFVMPGPVGGWGRNARGEEHGYHGPVPPSELSIPYSIQDKIWSIYVHFAGQKITITFLMLVRFQNFKDWQARDVCALLLVLYLE